MRAVAGAIDSGYCLLYFVFCILITDLDILTADH